MGNPFLKIIQDPTESEFLKTAKKTARPDSDY